MTHEHRYDDAPAPFQCQTCRHWHAREHDPGWGDCIKIGVDVGVSRNGERQGGAIVTRDTFGCFQHRSAAPDA